MLRGEVGVTQWPCWGTRHLVPYSIIITQKGCNCNLTLLQHSSHGLCHRLHRKLCTHKHLPGRWNYRLLFHLCGIWWAEWEVASLCPRPAHWMNRRVDQQVAEKQEQHKLQLLGVLSKNVGVWKGMNTARLLLQWQRSGESYSWGQLRDQGKTINQKHTGTTEIRTLKGQFHFLKILILKRFDKFLVNKPHF